MKMGKEMKSGYVLKPAKKTASKTNKNMVAPKAKPAKKMGAMRGY